MEQGEYIVITPIDFGNSVLLDYTKCHNIIPLELWFIELNPL